VDGSGHRYCADGINLVFSGLVDFLDGITGYT